MPRRPYNEYGGGVGGGRTTQPKADREKPAQPDEPGGPTPPQISEAAAIYQVKPVEVDDLPHWVSDLRDEIVADLNASVGRRLTAIERILRDVTLRPAAAVEQDRLLQEAAHNRGLAAAMMDDDWLGLELMGHLRQSPGLTLSDLSSKVEARSDLVASTLVRLAQYGAMEVQDGRYLCTERGLEYMQNLEKSTGISLKP